jgi:hypothetical protein
MADRIAGGDTQRKRRADADAVVAALGAEFGIRVPRHPQLHGSWSACCARRAIGSHRPHRARRIVAAGTNGTRRRIVDC